VRQVFIKKIKRKKKEKKNKKKSLNSEIKRQRGQGTKVIRD
jgi:hypothetical protein